MSYTQDLGTFNRGNLYPKSRHTYQGNLYPKVSVHLTLWSYVPKVAVHLTIDVCTWNWVHEEIFFSRSELTIFGVFGQCWKMSKNGQKVKVKPNMGKKYIQARIYKISGIWTRDFSTSPLYIHFAIEKIYPFKIHSFWIKLTFSFLMLTNFIDNICPLSFPYTQWYIPLCCAWQYIHIMLCPAIQIFILHLENLVEGVLSA